MSGAGTALRTALLAALRGDAVLAARLNGVWDGEPAQASPPFAVLREVAAGDWGTKDRAGRELRVAVQVRDAGDTAARTAELGEAIEAAVEGIARDLPGWRVASVALLRARIVADARGRWVATVEHRFRLLAAG